MKVSSTSERLKSLMKQRDLRQADILRMCQPYCDRYKVKISKGDLSQYVSGKFQPKQDKLSILGLALNVSEAWLMGLDVPETREISTTKNKILDITNSVVFTDEELEDIIQYMEFIISKRK